MTHPKLSLDDYYQHLDRTELKVMAYGWAIRFPVIKQITLYRANIDMKYVLDVRIDDSDKIEYRQFERDWIDNGCYLDRLRDAYITPNTDYCEDWLFLMPEVGGEPLLKDDQILTDSRLVLFPRDEERKQTPKQDVDGFIRELTVTPESDLEIKIKQPRKRPKTYNHEGLEFRDNMAEEWMTFLRILNNSGSYTVGQAGTTGTAMRKEYDRKLSYLRAIDKKLKHAFQKDFSLQLPDKYHLYELFKEEGHGVYKFKFRVEFSGEPAGSKLKAKYESYPKENLLKYLIERAGQQARTLGNGFKLQIDTIKGVLLERDGMDDGDIEDYIEDYINQKSDHEEINNEFSDLEKYESTI